MLSLKEIIETNKKRTAELDAMSQKAIALTEKLKHKQFKEGVKNEINGCNINRDSFSMANTRS
jgi:hypothetical protein